MFVPIVATWGYATSENGRSMIEGAPPQLPENEAPGVACLEQLGARRVDVSWGIDVTSRGRPGGCLKERGEV